jgi:hypothetical protein
LLCDIREIQNITDIGLIQNICPRVQLKLEIVKLGFMVSFLTWFLGRVNIRRISRLTPKGEGERERHTHTHTNYKHISLSLSLPL